MENTGSAEDKTSPTSHDQNFKNLIIDYPEDSLEFFAEPEAADLKGKAQILPIRQEQLKERLGDRFRELDIPLWVEWPDRTRELILFVIEEETDPGRFSIHRLARYCLDLSEMFNTRRVVPVVIFLHPGNFEEYLRLQGDAATYLHFRFIACHLKRIPAADHMNSTNVVARINLPNMAYDPKDRVEVYAQAQEGLMVLEKDPEKQLKYVDFIDFYMNLTDEELERYRQAYLSPIQLEEGVMGLRRMLHEEGRTEGLHRAVELGLKLKYGEDGLKLMNRVRAIKDPVKLEKIIKTIESTGSLKLQDFQKRIDA